jgi:hypothetical protein
VDWFEDVARLKEARKWVVRVGEGWNWLSIMPSGELWYQ